MSERTINVLLTSFPGLGLPSTLSIPIQASTTVAELTENIQSRIPSISSRLILTTPRNKQLTPSSSETLSSLLPDNESILPLRLSAPLCGGKGGFGSQLRAAGGRMSSKKKKNVGDPHASSRNLDGRRLRTVTEAKALAEYLAVKPEMDRKQKEARRQRWEQVVEAAERREEELKNGSGKGRLDAQWVEDREDAIEKTREAVRRAMASGDYKDVTFSKQDDSTGEEDGSDSPADHENASAPTSPDEAADSKAMDKGKGKAKETSKAYFGWDEDDEFMSSDEDDEEGDEKVEGSTAAAASA